MEAMKKGQYEELPAPLEVCEDFWPISAGQPPEPGEELADEIYHLDC